MLTLPDGSLRLLSRLLRARMRWQAAVSYFSVNVVKCCEIFGNVVKKQNVVKCCEIPSRSLARTSRFSRYRISQHSGGAREKTYTNFLMKSHTFCSHSMKVMIFGGVTWQLDSDFSPHAKCCEMLWNPEIPAFHNIFTTFHNISQHSANFHNISQHFTTFTGN